MRRILLSLTGAIGILFHTFAVYGVAEAQELEWYKKRVVDASVNESIQAAVGVEGGVLVTGFISDGARAVGSSLQLLTPDGSRLWRVEVPSAGPYPVHNSQPPLFSPHPDGGWWYVERRWEVEELRAPQQYFFVRHHISPDGELISSVPGEGGVAAVFRDGTLIGAPLNYNSEGVSWTIHNVDAGRTDTVTVDLDRAMSYFEETPHVAWSHVLRTHAYILLTDPLVGKCLLVSVDLTTGMTQMISLDDVPTTGLDGLVTRDGSVVILGREGRWQRGRNNLVLIRPQVEGREPERIRLPISSTDAPRIEGNLSTGELIIAMETEPNTFTERILYRIAADGSRISSLRFYNVVRWTMSIAPDDAMYVQWPDRMGKVTDAGPTSSISGDEPPADPWVELDLSGVE